MRSLRESCAKHAGRPISIALDTKGPEIRTGDLVSPDGIAVAAGDVFTLTTDEAKRACGTAAEVFIDYKAIGTSVKPGSSIYVDDGNLQLEVLEALPAGVKVRLPGRGR